ncbi:hypothetical protein SCHPADRAFT_945993 [Schizopora paradoxa]|uniref:Uncharacterized protein n=1 Tax=Schizopora paradoxa TaxID=27342 RepID=A0A0H2R5E5_9AGAM|nr:hypothetical protein SCHPADRAFT_945993 [Schizopora paradoxa]
MSLKLNTNSKEDVRVLPSDSTTTNESRQQSTSKVVVEARTSRARGSILTRVKAMSNFAGDGGKRDVESVVKKIEQIRRHGETTIFERHADTSISLSDAEIAKLKSLCQKLLQLSGSRYATERYACEEMIRLSIEDPRVHLFLKERKLYPSDSPSFTTRTCCDHARLTIEDASVKVHELWSGLFQISRGLIDGSAQSNDTMAKYLKNKNSLFLDSLKNHKLSFLSARYLRHALKLQDFGNALYFIVNLWHRYMKIAQTDASRPYDKSIVEWSNLDACFQCLPSGVLRTAYAPPAILADLLAQIILGGRAHEVSSVFLMFFGVPEVQFQSVGKQLVRLRFTKISVDATHFRLLPVYHTSLIAALESSSLASLCEADPRLREVIKNTILEHHHLWTEYSDQAGKICKNRYRDLSPETEPFQLNSHLLELLRRQVYSDHALAKFIAASLVSAWPGKDIQIPPDVVSNVEDLVGVLSLPLFDNVPYLRRYHVKETGKMFITSDNLPEPPSVLIKSFKESLIYDFTVDTLPFEGINALWLHVDGRNAPLNVNLPPFLTFHFALISAEDPKEKGNPIYVAAVKVGSTYHFTYATDGSSCVKYTDEIGKERESQDFFILAERKSRDIREDDLTSNVTGRWLPFWPVRDPEYLALSDSAESDDEHLKALLNSFHREMVIQNNNLTKYYSQDVHRRNQTILRTVDRPNQDQRW